MGVGTDESIVPIRSSWYFSAHPLILHVTWSPYPLIKALLFMVEYPFGNTSPILFSY